jgi:penicillin-binding protein 2
MGIEKLVGYLKLFGFDSKLGIDLPGEQEGFLPSVDWKEKTKHEKWYIGDTYNVSIGQGDLLVTPLQIANMTATIANGGTLYKPHVAKAVIDPLTNAKTLFQPEVVRSSVMSTQNLATIRLGMRDCVTSGSCSLLSRLPFTSAGKTGTAQWNKNKDTHAWFTSFAPFENPEIVVTILVEEGGEGSAISEPIARQFYDWWWKYKNGLK